MQIWTTFLVLAACLLSLAASLSIEKVRNEQVPGQKESLQLLFGHTNTGSGVRWNLWQGPRGIPIYEICYDNVQKDFTLVAMFPGPNGDLAHPPWPGKVETFKGSILWSGAETGDCFYFNDGKGNAGTLQCGDDPNPRVKVDLAKDPGYGERLMSCNKGDVHEDWARGYFVEFN